MDSMLSPSEDQLKLNTDGSVKKPSGAGRASRLLRDCEGRRVVGFSLNIAHTNSLMAELSGAREHIKMMKRMGLTNLILEMNSASLVILLKQGVGRDHPLHHPIFDCINLQGVTETKAVSRTCKEGNREADFLANMEHVLSRGVHEFHSPPLEIMQILQKDARSLHLPKR